MSSCCYCQRLHACSPHMTQDRDLAPEHGYGIDCLHCVFVADALVIQVLLACSDVITISW